VARAPVPVLAAALAALGLASLGLNYRAHALVCVLACAILLINYFLGSRIRRGWQFAGLIVVGVVFAYVMPTAARAGLFGSALQHKTVDQDTYHVPMLLAGRTEPPMSITAILERPLLGWGSAMNMTPDAYTHAQHLAMRLGFSPNFPFDVLWGLPPSNYSAMHSILLGSWAEGGVLAVLLPAYLLVACLGIVWNFTRLRRWAPLGVTVALQGIWDILYGPWLYNMIPTFVCIALLFSAIHFRGTRAEPPTNR
jgi:O-antigen ligase